jgi:hypothetical protein
MDPEPGGPKTRGSGGPEHWLQQLVTMKKSGNILSSTQGWAKLVLIALERYSVALKRLTFNLR